MLLYISAFGEMWVELYPEWESTLDFVKFYAFLFGTYYSQNTGIYKFNQMSSGFLLIVALLMIEIKSQIWLKRKQGCKPNIFEFFQHVELKSETIRNK